MDNALYASVVIDDCSMPCVCENASMSVNPHNCDDMLLESMSVVDKLLKKGAKKFHKNLSKFRCEKDDLIAKLNESNKLVEKYKKLAENTLEKLKEFECLNMDLDAKLVLSNKLVDNFKCENESLKMHAKCLIVELVDKNDDNICCNHVVVFDFVPIVCSTSKDKSVYIPPHKRNRKMERKALKPKPLFRSHPRELSGSKFVPTCHHCGAFGHLRPHCSKFQALKRIKRKEKLELLRSYAKKDKPDLSDNSMLLKKMFNALNSLSMCISGSHSPNPRLTSHEILIPSNHCVWMRKGSYG